MKSHSEQTKSVPCPGPQDMACFLIHRLACPCGSMHKGHLGGGETLKRDRKNHGIWKRLGNTGKLMEIVEIDGTCGN